MNNAFDTCFTLLIGHEGGYVSNPKDPGGETNWGISKRSYPDVNMKTLTRDGARAIYHRDFWQPMDCDNLPPALALVVFDTAVNSGKGRARELLTTNPADWRTYLADRLLFMASLDTWPTFGKGWARRIANLSKQAAGLEVAAALSPGRVFLTALDGTVVLMTDKETTYSGAHILRHDDGAVSISRA